MRNHTGDLAECSQSNLFVVSRGLVRTPPLGAGLLPGITRAFVLELCGALGLPAEEAVLHDADLTGAEEAFLTSTTREVVPIVRVDGRPIGSGRPGPITSQLLAAFRSRVATAV
jgi:branched-chain amino acid aminotransferase